MDGQNHGSFSEKLTVEQANFVYAENSLNSSGNNNNIQLSIEP